MSKESFRSGRNKAPQVVLQQQKGGISALNERGGAADTGRNPLHVKQGAGPSNAGPSEANKRNARVEQKRSLVDILKENINDLVPEKIKKIGIAGLPSIYFSGSETTFLAERLGFSVVGKFSGSTMLPSRRNGFLLHRFALKLISLQGRQRR